VTGAVTLVSIPQLLAAQHVSEPTIASLTALALVPTFLAFIFGPLLDWRFRRKSYAIGFTAAGAACVVGALVTTTNPTLVAVFEFAAMMGISIGNGAMGGWFSSLIKEEDAGRLGAWFTVANVGSLGVCALLTVSLIRATSPLIGGLVLGFLAAAPLLLFFLLPCKPADGRLAHESLLAFARDVTRIVRAPTVLWTLLLLLSPAASFALTNILGGLGRDFSTSEQAVSLLLGVGSVIAGVIGSLIVPKLEMRFHPFWLYLAIGAIGAGLTLVTLVLPRQPGAFAFAVLSENMAQAAAFSVGNAIILRSIGADSPLAATQFSLLISAVGIPLTYMQVLDGQGYAMGSLRGAFLMDAGVSGLACLVLAAVFWRFKAQIPAA
jgi:PAT family beta-lactamase induction signal transducer AmpG